MSGMKSKRKGKLGELEASKLLTELLGVEWRRSQQVKGTQESADVETVEVDTNLWAEVKRDESTISKKMYDIMKQAEEEAGEKTPFLMSRRNREKWLFVVDEDNLIEFCRGVMELLND